MNKNVADDALRGLMGRRMPAWARYALVLAATAVFAVFAYHARYAKIDEFTGFRMEEMTRLIAGVLAALYALTVAVELHIGRKLNVGAQALLCVVVGLILLAKVSLFDYVSEQVYDKHGIIMLDPLGINNTYCIAVPESVAEEYNLETISDLVPVAGELTFGAEHEFFAAEGTAGTMKFGPFTEFYGLNFKETFPVDISLKYTAIENGNFQVTEVYTTDGLNRKANLKVLEDDRNFFPEYNGSLLVREELFEEMADVAPDLREILGLLSGTMDNEKMTDMTYAVDVEGRTVDEVAREFLVENGLLDA